MMILLGVLIVLAMWLITRVRDEGGWSFETRVVHGSKVARKIDWKTANLLACPPEAKQPGFYLCRTNFGDATLLRRDAWGECELHVHDFDSDIYGETIKLKRITRLEKLPFKLVKDDTLSMGTTKH